MIIEEVKSNYVWKKVGDDIVLVKSGEKDIDNEKKHLITLSRMNKNFPYTVYVKGKENKKLQSELPSDNLKEIKDYILKNINKILGEKVEKNTNESLDDAYPNGVKYAVVYRNLEDDSLIDAKVYDDYSKAIAVYSAEIAKGSDGYTYIDIEEVTPESSLWKIVNALK